MSERGAISFAAVSKSFPVSPRGGWSLKETLLHLPRYLRRPRRQAFFALRDVSLAVRPGECMGVIGRNGSGKSTTLGLIAGVLRPNAGQVRTVGRICPLLELGAGFHNELSGRDNIVLNGVLLGMRRRQVFGLMDRIIAFAEIEEFIDRPLRSYSSGMVARLGFSVAVHLDPDILLVDEALAVGDEAFQDKCLRRMRQFHQAGVTIVFVSHDLKQVEAVCDRAVLLDRGRLAAEGPPGEVIAHYEKLLAAEAES